VPVPNPSTSIERRIQAWVHDTYDNAGS